jgi:hypothetical protein
VKSKPEGRDRSEDDRRGEFRTSSPYGTAPLLVAKESEQKIDKEGLEFRTSSLHGNAAEESNRPDEEGATLLVAGKEKTDETRRVLPSS